MKSRVRSRGQATVEFALVLPLVLCAIVVLADVTWLAVDQLRVNDASRNAARAAVVEQDGFDAVAALTARELLGERVQVKTTVRDGLLSVQVSRQHDFLTPFLSSLMRSVFVRATSTMLLERRISTIGG